MDVTQILMLITILVYLAAMVGIGAVLAKQNQTTDDFYLGGRTLGPLVTAMSAEASDMSSWLLMGLPGVAYLSGTADAAWTAIGLAIGTYVNWLVVAKRLRNYTHVCGNSTTLPLFFSNRYRDNRRILSVIAALLIIIFFVPYTASGFAACGKLFANLFGMPEIADDPRAASLEALHETDFVVEIVTRLNAIFKTKTVAEWEAFLSENNVSCERMRTIRDVSTDEQAIANGYIQKVTFKDDLEVMMPCPPMQLTEYATRPYTSGGRLGADTDSIFHDLGYTDSEIAAMKDSGAIQ